MDCAIFFLFNFIFWAYPPRLGRGGRAMRGYSRLWRPADAAPTIPYAGRRHRSQNGDWLIF